MAHLCISPKLLTRTEERHKRLVEQEKFDRSKAPSATLVIQLTPSFSHWTRPQRPLTPLSPSFNHQTGETAPTTPLPPAAPRPPAPILTREGFIALHRARDRERAEYLRQGSRKCPSLDPRTRAELNVCEAFALPANNMIARISYAQLMAEHLARFTDALPPKTPLFFVTLVRRDHAVPLEEAAAFDTARVTGWTHQLLRGASYIGMVEGAYHTTLHRFGISGPIAVSWHSHSVVWDLDEPEFVARIAAANARYPALIPGLDPAHYLPLDRDEVFGRSLYLAKGQLREYRTWPRKRTEVDARMGEFVEVLTGRYTLKKRDLRPRDAVHACRAFADRTINGLAFAAGDGRPVLRNIHRAALAEFHRWEARQPHVRLGV